MNSEAWHSSCKPFLPKQLFDKSVPSLVRRETAFAEMGLVRCIRLEYVSAAPVKLTGFLGSFGIGEE